MAAATSATRSDQRSQSPVEDDRLVRKPEGAAPADEPVIPSAFATAERQRSDSALRRNLAELAGAAALGGVVAALLVLLLARSWSAAPDAPDASADIATLRSEVEQLRQAMPEGGSADLTPLQGQIAAMEQSIAELRSSAPTGDASAALQELQQRLAALESGIAGAGDGEADPALEGQLQETGQALASIEAQLADLSSRVDQTGASVDEARTQAEAALALGPAIVAEALSEALEAGAPFTAELQALRNLGIDEDAIAGLDAHAEIGLPTLAELRAAFEAQAAAVDPNPPPPETTGTVDRLLESARGLVEVRPANPVSGSDPPAILARIRGALDAGDLQTALTEWQALPEDARSKTADWAGAAEARLAADALVARIRGDALSHVGSQG